MVNVKDVLIPIGIGLLSGMGTDYLWSTLKLPGWGKIAFNIGKRADGENLDMGFDDLIELGIGGGVTAYGVKEKNAKIVAGGAGFIGGVALTKLFEVYGSGVTPMSMGSFLAEPNDSGKSNEGLMSLCTLLLYD